MWIRFASVFVLDGGSSVFFANRIWTYLQHHLYTVYIYTLPETNKMECSINYRNYKYYVIISIYKQMEAHFIYFLINMYHLQKLYVNAR